ncbi:MAG TPA: choice-of-anchor D domain-containing protein [Kofleriaceae bacterium]
MVRGHVVGSLVGAALAITLAPGMSAAQPEIDVTPATSHNFGNQLVTAGATANFTFTIENTATANNDDLDVASITKVGAQCADFNLTAPATPFTIQQQSDQDIMVSFDPSVQGARACTIRIDHNDPDGGEDPFDLAVSGTGTARVVSLSPSPLNFGNVVRNASSNQTLTIDNTGNVPLTVSALAIGGAQANQFSLVSPPGTPFDVAGGGSQDLTVRCTPTSNGAKTATLTVTSNATSGTGTVTLNCTGVDPQIGVDPTSLPFPDTNVGASSNLNFTVSNGAAANSSVLTYYFTEGGTNPGDFAVTASNCTLASPCTLVPGNSRVHTVTFTPLDLGSRSATLTVEHDDQDVADVVVSLSGTGRRPEITLVQPPGASIDFGEVPVGTNSTQSTVTVRNDGNGNLVIDAVTLTGSDPGEFAISSGSVPPPSITVGPGGTATWRVRCHPTSQGVKTASFRIDNDDNQVTPEDPLTVSLTCRGVRSTLVADPSPVEFPDTQVGTSADPVTVTLTNTGDTPLTLHGVSLSSSAFPVSGGLPELPLVLQAGGSTELAIGFDPTLQTAYGGTLTLQTDTDVHVVVLSGRGVLPEMALDPAPHDFGAVEVSGEAAVQLFTITSSAAAPFQLGSVSVDAPAFTVTRVDPAAYPASIDPGGTATFEVAALPGAVGAANGTLTVTTTISPSTLTRTRVSAMGSAPNLVLSEGAVDFGAVDLAAAEPARRTVTLTNSGEGPLVLSSVELSGPQAAAYAIVGPPAGDVTVPPGGDFALELEYQPSVESNLDAANLAIDTDAGADVAIPIAGRGAARDIQVSPLWLEFAETYRNPAEPAQLSVQVANRGSSALTVAGISGGGAAIDSFTLVDAPAAVGAGGEATFTVAFAPTAASAEPIAAELVLAHDGSDEPAVRIDLTGVAVLPNLAMAPGVIDLGSTGVGVPVHLSEVAPDQLQIINQDSDETFTVAAIRVADMDGNAVEGGPFQVVSFTPMSEIAPGEALPVDIEFNPDQEGEFEAVIELYVGADPTRIAFVTVRGRGTDVTLRGGGGCGCRAGGGTGAGDLGLMVLVLAFLLRRRRLTRPA